MKKKKTSEVLKNQEESEMENTNNSEVRQEPTAFEEGVEMISDDEKTAESKPEYDLVQNDLRQDSNKKEKKDNKFIKKLKKFFSEKKYRPARIGIYAGLAILISAFIFGFVLNPFESTKFKIVSVRASKIENYITANDSAFLIQTEGGSLEEVKKHLYLEPALDYEISEKSKDEYELKLANRLADNLIFNIDYIENEIPEYKWAFQTKKELSVSKVYPADGATYVDENSAVQVALSYSNVKDFESHFSITPEVGGDFENVGNVWTFKPTEEFAENTTYTVTISAGLKSGEETMKNDYVFSFSTFEKSTTSTQEHADETILNTIFTGRIETFTQSEQPKIKLFESARTDHISSIELFKISTSSDYIKYLNNENVPMESTGDVTFSKDKNIITFDKNLSEGYYIAQLKDQNGNRIEKANIQINDTSAYAMETERDALIWIAKNGELKSDVKVWYKDKEYRTNENGIAILDDVSDFSGAINYLTVENNNFPLVVGLTNYKNDTYPTAYVYTDRPLYKSTDTINIWGYVPLSFFRDAPNLNNFSIVFGEKKQSVEINPDGSFMTKIELNNYEDGWKSINLVYNDQPIGSKGVTVENYNAKTYIYETKIEKNYVRAGENFDFDVHVKHITGLNAVGKDVMVTYDSKEYISTTDKTGTAHFSVPTAPANYSIESYKTLEYEGLVISSTGSSYDKWTDHAGFYKVNSRLQINLDRDTEKKNVEFKSYLIELGENVSIDNFGNGLQKNPYEGTIKITVSEKTNTRVITDYKYDNYTKTNNPVYTTYTNETRLKSDTGQIENGKFTYSYDWLDVKKNTDDVSYSYEISFLLTDPDGRQVYSTGSYLTSGVENIAKDNDAIYHSSRYCSSSDYDAYEYALKKESDEACSINEVVNFGLVNKDGGINNKGKVLQIIYKEDIVETNLITSDDFDVKFTESFYPESRATGAYFLDGKFYRMPSYLLDYNQSDSELTVIVEPEKKDYEPGEEVHGKIIVKDKDENPVDAIINISVVNEGVFNMINDSTDVLSAIYRNKNFDSYTFSTYRNYSIGSSSGGCGAGGMARSNFGDTIYFDQVNLKNGSSDFSFKLNDEITSFRITAHAVSNSKSIMAGASYEKINSFLPLAIYSVKPDGVKNTDDLILSASAIASTGNIHYVFEIEETGKKIEKEGNASQETYANFGKLPIGTYHAKISATDAENKDALEYEFKIAESFQEVDFKQTVDLNSETTIKPAKSPINIEIYNKNTGVYVRLLDHLSSIFSERLDTKVAYYKAEEYRNKYYGTDEKINIPTFDDYVVDGVAKILSKAEPDLVLTGLLNYYVGDYFDFKVKNFGIDFDTDLDSSIKQYFVLASFKEPVLDNLRALRGRFSEMSEESKLLYALSLEFLGDYDGAKEFAKAIYGQEFSGTNGDLYLAFLTFLYKDTSKAELIEKIESDPSSDYLNFAILSFFENYNTDISKKEIVEIETSSGTETVELNGVSVKKLSLYDNELDTLKFSVNSNDLVATYYYKGYPDQISDQNLDLDVSLHGNLNLSNTIELEIDPSGLSEEEGTLNIALPNSAKFNEAGFSDLNSNSGAYIMKNSSHFLKIKTTRAAKVKIPLYLAMPGETAIEKIVFVDSNGGYHLSNDLILDIKE